MKSQRVRLSRLRQICIVLLLLGLLFRVINLDRKVYWHDEAFTSLEVSAHGPGELVRTLFTDREVEIAELQQYQRLDPERGMGDMLYSLGTEDPQHPPLYYILTRWWVQWWGTSITSTRSIAVVLSLLVFPGAYWLCIELFESSATAWVAIALLAISPLTVLYAQEAREYGFFTALILFSSAAFLRAMRHSNWGNWGLYIITLILSLYTALFSIFVVLGHGLYALFNNQFYSLSITAFRLEKRIGAYAIAVILAGIAFIPWLYFLINYAYVTRASAGWVTISLPALTVFKMWIVNLCQIFWDFDRSPFNIKFPITYYVAAVPTIALEILAIVFLGRNTPKRVWLFILTLIGGTLLGLALPDFLLGGQRSTVTRYLFPLFLGLQLAVAHLLATQLISTNPSRRQIGKVLAVIVVVIGVASCAVSSQADTWWNKVVSYDNAEIARVINASDRPVLITDSFAYNPANAISLSYLLNENVKFLLLQQVSISHKIPTVPEKFKSVFLWNLPGGLMKDFEQKYHSKLVPVAGELWKEEKVRQ